MKISVKHILNEQGWIEMDNIHTDYELLKIASELGTIINHPNGNEIAIVKSKTKDISIKGTFSNLYGYNEFPLHTDTAFWSKPARYVLLSSEKISQSETFIVHKEKIWQQLTEIDKRAAERAIFLIKTIHGQHYSSLLFKESGITGLRYDTCTMFPFNKSAIEIQNKLKDILSETTPNRIVWSGNKVVVFDNWFTLHGRSKVDQSEERELKRIYIN